MTKVKLISGTTVDLEVPWFFSLKTWSDALKADFDPKDKKNGNDIYDFCEKIFFPTGVMETKDEKGLKEEHYPYIPFYTKEFIDAMSRFLNKKFRGKDRKQIKFIDCGCGNGDKVFIARKFFDLDSSGIEYTQETFHVAKFLFHKLFFTQEVDLPQTLKDYNGRKLIHLYNGDGKEFDFSDYDIIYTYVPIRERKSLFELWENIFNTMKIGAYWYEVSSSYRSEFFYFKGILGDNNYYQIIKKTGKNSIKAILKSGYEG